ncbi:MAG TPA: outer membrane protein assembly factor BamD [Polyangiales bacterium]|nr:outer membrane protein assembly factor BamD [Polyangiales bacterium]
MARPLSIFYAACCSAVLAGCASSGELGAASYGDNAARAYRAALDEFYDDDCFEAEPLFRNVRREFPYSRFAAVADLRVADCNMKDGKYAEAIEAYNQFVRYRPSHPEVPYARFMAALAHFEQIPSDWLLAPPAFERDQHYAQESLRLLRRFMLDFPEDPLMPRARRMAEQAVRLLAAHELYVADFYLSREHPKAAAGRLNTLLRSYPGSGFEPEALYLLGESYVQMEDAKSARRAFQELVTRFPNDDYANKARNALGELGG